MLDLALWLLSASRLPVHASGLSVYDTAKITMPYCELVDIFTQPDWVIAIARVDNGYRCWVFTPEFTVLDDGEVHPTRESAAETARRLVLDSREY